MCSIVVFCNFLTVVNLLFGRVTGLPVHNSVCQRTFLTRYFSLLQY